MPVTNLTLNIAPTDLFREIHKTALKAGRVYPERDAKWCTKPKMSNFRVLKFTESFTKFLLCTAHRTGAPKISTNFQFHPPQA